MASSGWVISVLVILGCAADDGGRGGGRRDGGPGADTGGAPIDVGPGVDSGPRPDTGPGMDSGGGDVDAGPGSPDAGPTGRDDVDGDGISDGHEGRLEPVPRDTDSDGTPDWMDADSDGDGISDADEAGDGDASTPPIDSDFDDVPDYRDLDSDGNGVPDAVEGGDDIDGDGRRDHRDPDNDDDGLDDLTQIAGTPASPPDPDGDGLPDYDDRDSDGDTIGDLHEGGSTDTDADTTTDGHDLDSDDDGFTDATEAGDADLATAPVDTDSDTIPDFRDPDSDGDGLSDRAERMAGTDRARGDTDGDGVSDLIEVGAGTDPRSASDSPRTRGDFVFVVPYMMPPDPTRDTLQFSTTLVRADIYFLMDNTGSMGGTIANLQSGLRTTVIPDIRGRIPEAWFGVGGFDDYPIGTYGEVCPWSGVDSAGISHDMAFFQYQTMTADDARTQTAVNRYQTNCGFDGPESGVAALYSLATRDTLGGYARFPGTSPPACPAGYRGSACFRPDAVPIVVVMTDVDQHNAPTCACNYDASVPGRGPSWASTIAALGTLNARTVGIAASTGANAFLTRMVQDTTIARGAPGAATDYVLSAPGGTGLSRAVTDAVARAAAVPLDVSARAVDVMDPGETINAVTAFLDHLETRTVAAPGLMCTLGLATSDRAGIDADAFPDTFDNVTPGAPVCFDIIPRMNTTVMPTLDPQIFRARINVIGDGFTPLDDRDVYFLVPPRIPDPNE